MMNSDNPLLTIRFDGKAIGPGKIPVSHLLHFLSSMNKALLRTARLLRGGTGLSRPGRPPRALVQDVELDLVLLTHGSPTAVLGFEPSQPNQSLPDMDFGLEVLEKAIDGLGRVQEDELEEPLPSGYDTGVMMAWRDAGTLFRKDVSTIEITLNKPASPKSIVFSSEGFERLRNRIKAPQTNIHTVEGRLLMADFKEHGTRCRVHPSAGEPVLCLFDEEQKDEVLDNILHYVRIVGEGEEDAVSGKITGIKIHDIEQLEGFDDEAIDLLPQGTPIESSFWKTPTLDELAMSQHVQPTTGVRALFGTWPGEDDDGFEEAVDELRHPGVNRQQRS